jgi:anti-anti-sigma regulatory factor
MVDGQVVFKLSGQLDQGNIAELEKLISSEGKGKEIVLDLRDVTLVGQDAITFLVQCEVDNITLLNCAPYIREWITLQRGGR